MSYRKYLLPFMIVSLAALLVASCGKKGDDEDKQEAAKTGGALEQLAREAAGAFSIDDEYIEAREMIEAADFTVRSYEQFPVEEVGKKGRMLVYTDKRGKHSGGVVYVKKTGAELAPSWHWYFEDMVPDSVEKIELNGDGLWDVRIHLADKHLDFVQLDSFTLLAKDREDWIAMNGQSSPPVSDDLAMWKCFDGDTATAWVSSLGTEEAFLEFDVPFGVQTGILSIHSLATGQPKGCAVYADGKQIQELELKPVASEQMVHLNSGVTGAKRIRLVFNSTYGDGEMVAVGELSLK